MSFTFEVTQLFDPTFFLLLQTISALSGALRPAAAPSRPLQPSNADEPSSSSDVMSVRFHRVWGNRSPVEVEIDELAAESRLTWEERDVHRKALRQEDKEMGETRARIVFIYCLALRCV